jgi:Ca2+-binding EF-hand superfamily protein
MACAFAFFDVDGDGAIQPGELRDTLKRIRPGISDATVDDILERADSDHNGEISPDEFGAALLRAYSASLRRCSRS